MIQVQDVRFRKQGLEGRGWEKDASSGAPEMCSGSEAGSYLRLIDLCITQL